MAKSGPEAPPRPAHQPALEAAGAKNAFDGEESTEVMDVPIVPAKVAAAIVTPEEPQDLEEKDKKYIAPRVIPAAAVPEKADGAKIVLNIPDARADRAPPAPPAKPVRSSVEGDKPAVAEVRARRRAPTVKIARPNLTALKPDANDIDVSMEDDFEPPPPLEAPAVDGAPLTPSKGLVQAVPIGLAPTAEPRSPAPVSQRISAPTHEAPATAIAIHETRAEKSRLPWVLFGALTLGAAAAGVFVATRKPDAAFVSKVPAATQTTTTTTTTTAATVTAAPPATETVAATATPEPTASGADAGTSATVTATASAAPTQVAVNPRPPYPRPTATTPTYTAPRPTATFPRPPPKKTSDIPSGI